MNPSYVFEQPTFGRRVRSLRLARGLTQAELAGGGMSTSYVSLVENGRRMPGTDIAKAIAERLDVSLSHLAAPDEAPDDEARQRAYRRRLIGVLMTARMAATYGDHQSARDQLLAGLREATPGHSDEVAWELGWELAEVCYRLDDHKRQEETLRDLLDNRLTADSALLRSRVLATLSNVARRIGQLAESVRWAEHAVASADGLEPTSPGRVLATLAQIFAYADSGAWEPASRLVENLLDHLDKIREPQLVGLACWAAGTVYFFTDQNGARDMFDRALTLIDPAANLRLWGRLCRGAAAYLVAVGNCRDAKPLLSRASTALDLVGRPADKALVAEVRLAARWRADGVAALKAEGSNLARPRCDLPRQELARCLVLRARIAQASNRLSESATTYREAAGHYEAAGAYRLASEAWREFASLTAGCTDNPTRNDHHAFVMP